MCAGVKTVLHNVSSTEQASYIASETHTSVSQGGRIPDATEKWQRHGSKIFEFTGLIEILTFVELKVRETGETETLRPPAAIRIVSFTFRLTMVPATAAQNVAI